MLSRARDYLKASNYFSFFTLLSFRESDIIPRQRIILVSTHFSTIASLVLLRHFSTFQPWTIWRKTSAQSGVTFSSSSVGLLRCPSSLLYSKPSLVYTIFLTPTKILVVTPLAHSLHLDTFPV